MPLPRAPRPLVARWAPTLTFTVAAALVALAPTLAAQPVSNPPGRDPFGEAPSDSARAAARAFGTSYGAGLLLTEYGFGLGGTLRHTAGPTTAVVLEGGLTAGKDEREQQFFVGFFGDTVVPFKRHYVVMAPLHAGVEQRLFADAIEANFRPFVQATAGPTLAYQWPYFDDANDNGVRDEGEPRLGYLDGLAQGEGRIGVGGTLAVGAWLGRSRRSAQGVRFGYAGSYFFEPVELLELDPGVEGPSRRFFGTPVVSFHFVRLY